MKTAFLFIVSGGLAFGLAAYQMGIFTVTAVTPDTENPSPKAPEKKPAPPKLRFPADLAPAARAEPVPQAAAYKQDAAEHKIVVLQTTGALHPWQEYLQEEWQAERVEETELVLVVGPQRKIYVDTNEFVEGPPVVRYKHEVEAALVEAKTGRVLANRVFINMPRAIAHEESLPLTALGRPVPFNTVFQWTVSRIRAGFPLEDSPQLPLVVTVD